MILSPRDAQLFAAATLQPALYEDVIPLRPELFDEHVLRDYQLRMLLEAARLMRLGYRRILLQLPTGGGKTVMACQMLGAAQALGLPAQFIVHRKELLKQTSSTFALAGIDHGFVAADFPMSPHAPTILSGVATLVRRLAQVLLPNLVVLDECHHAAAASWDTILEAFSDAFIIGLTATPERLDGQGLDKHFDIMVRGPEPAELIARGFLSPYDYYAPKPALQPDLPGKFTETQAAEVMDRPELVGDVVEHYLRLARGKKGIVFAASIAHSRNLVAAFKAAGVRAEHIDADSPDRDEIDEAFRNDEIDVLVNVGLLGEGYDVPGIVYVGLARPTKSLALFLQMVGRALRVIYGAGFDLSTDAGRLAAIAAGPKQKGIICDHAGNAFTHGLPDDPRDWALEGRLAQAKGQGNSDAEPVRQCMGCYGIWPSTIRVCPRCDTAFGLTAREIKIRDGELQKLERDARRAEAERIKAEKAAARAAEAQAKKELAIKCRAEEREAKTYAQLYDLAVGRGIANPEGWARLKQQLRRQYAARR